VLTITALAGCASDGDDVPTDTPPTSNVTETPTGTPTPTETSTPDQTTTAASRRDVIFETADGVALVGTTYGDGPCGVVLVPQADATRAAWAPQARRLAARGYLAFAIETAATPDTDGDPTASVDGAVTYLREGHDVERVVLVGAGTGGEAVVAVASRRQDVDGVVALSATGGATHAANLSGRNLFVASEGDPAHVVETTRTLGDDATVTTDVVVYEGSAHGRALFTSEHRADLHGRLRTVLRDVCAT
jgi:dienelactone hydrolase